MLRQAFNLGARTVRVAATPTNPIVRCHSQQPQAIFQVAQRTRVAAAGPVSRRMYSTTQEPEDKKESTTAPAGDAAAATDAASSEATLKKALEAKEAEARDWKDKALRQTAEFYNLQERTAREKKQAREFAIQSFAKDLLFDIDNLDRALVNVPAAKLQTKAEERSEDLQDLVNLFEGLKMTETALMRTLEKHGLARFDPQGEKFNPHEHDATFMTPQPDKEDNTVFHVQQKGFKLNGRILRAAKVGVVKNK